MPNERRKLAAPCGLRAAGPHPIVNIKLQLCHILS